MAPRSPLVARGGTAVSPGGSWWVRMALRSHPEDCGCSTVTAGGCAWHRGHLRWLVWHRGHLRWLAVAPRSLLVARGGTAVTWSASRWHRSPSRWVPVGVHGTPGGSRWGQSLAVAPVELPAARASRWHRGQSWWLAVGWHGLGSLPLGVGGTAVSPGVCTVGAGGTAVSLVEFPVVAHGIVVTPGGSWWMCIAPRSPSVARNGNAVSPDGSWWVHMAPRSPPVACG